MGRDKIRVGQEGAPLPANFDQIAAVRAISVQKNHQLFRGAGFRLNPGAVNGRHHMLAFAFDLKRARSFEFRAKALVGGGGLDRFAKVRLHGYLGEKFSVTPFMQ